MRKSKKGWIFLLCLLLAAGLIACGGTGDQESAPETVTLVYASLTEKGAERGLVETFNRTHRGKGVQIEIREYLDEDGRSGRDRLLTEMVAGNIPDIIDMGDGSEIPYQQLARKGYLEDLWPYIRNDPDLGAEGALWEVPLKAAEIDGGLYALFKGASVCTLVGAESVVGDRYSWTLAELQEAFSAMPEESSVLEFYYTKSEMFSYIFRMSIDSYVDWETGELDFDSARFRSALEFINSFRDEFHGFDFEDGKKRVEAEAFDYWRSGQQMLTFMYINSPGAIQAVDAVFGRGGRAGLVGYPTEDGSAGSFFRIRGRMMAMSSACRNKEAAWKVIRQMILPRFKASVYMDGYAYIPINRADYDKMIQWDVRLPAGQRFPMYVFFDDNVRYQSHKATKTEIERFEDFINRIDQTDVYDTVLYNIVYEACGPYFAGDKTLDETIWLLENRVSLYLNEQR